MPDDDRFRVGPHRFTDSDARRTFANLGEMWRMHVLGLPEVPGAAGAAVDGIVHRLAAATGTDPTDGPVDRALDHLGAAADRCIADRTWDHERTELELAAAWTAIRTAGRELRAAGLVATAGDGTVHQLNTSGGGVPKSPVDAVDVDWAGVVGDRQASRQHHGRPWQALCLWSREVIDDFASAGHRLRPGAAGENVTTEGLDWSLVRPGVVLRIGTVRCEVSAYALPCSKNAQWFVDREFSLMHHERGPVSRVYATVLEPGRIATGDPVSLEP